MGKKLRNRELLTETDLENQDEVNQLPLKDEIKTSAMRKIIRSKLCIKKGEREYRINKFRNRLINRQISQILSPNRFQCSICLELMVSPVIMGCGHAFCHRCLESNTAYTEKCCLCRSDHKGGVNIPLKFVEILIEKFLVPYGPELIRYLCRTTDSAEWLKRRRIANFKLGLVVDFQDRCNIWRRGVIVNVLNNEQIQIKTNIKGIDLFQKIERTSKRLAPYTFFTRNRYLQDFPPILPEYDPTQNSLSKLEYNPHWHEDSSFQFPLGGSAQNEQNEQDRWEYFEDQALRIFNSEMNEIDSILNI